jgi:nitroreductase
MPEADLRTLFDAARWAPSAFNYQPWRFLYARRGDANWDLFLSLLVPMNQSWAKEASVLMFIVTDTMSEAPDKGPVPLHSHSFDAGAAWAQLTLQAVKLGYHTHGMVGIDFDRIRSELGIPERFRIEAGVAVGRQADASILPEALQAREVPSGRKAIDEIAFPGKFVA